MTDLYIFIELSRAAEYGIGTYVRELTHALQGINNLSVCIIYLNSDKKDFKQEEIDGIRNWYFPAPIQSDYYKNSELEASYRRNVVYILQLYVSTYNQLIFHLNFNNSEKLVSRLKDVFSCRTIVTVHYSEWGSLLLGNIQRLNQILSREQSDDFEKSVAESLKLEQTFYSQIDKVISLTENMKDILMKHYLLDEKKITIIPNGLTDSMSDTAEEVMNLRKKWMIDQETKIIVFAGRLNRIKGVDYLIRSFKLVLQHVPNCRLVIAGSGRYEPYLKEAQDICTKVTFTGLLDKEKLYELYRLADVGIVPSLYEPFGYVTVEMMMHSLPIVVTATSGLNEIVKDGVSGLKVPIKEYPDRVEIDHRLLAEKILYLLQHPKDAKQMGMNARKRYLENYTSEIFGRNMMRVYQSLFDEVTNDLLQEYR